MATQLALPSGERQADNSLAVYGVIAAGVVAVVALGTLLAAWFALRSGTPEWPPKGFTFQEYYGNTLAVTVLMSGFAGWWALYGVLKGERRQAAAALALVIFLDVAFINLVTYVLRSSKLSPSANGFAVLLYALSGTVIVVAGIGVLIAGVALARVLGGQVTKQHPALGWAAAWFSTFVFVSWMIVYTAFYVVQ